MISNTLICGMHWRMRCHGPIDHRGSGVRCLISGGAGRGEHAALELLGGEHLTQYVREHAAVAVVLSFDRGVHAC